MENTCIFEFINWTPSITRLSDSCTECRM